MAGRKPKPSGKKSRVEERDLGWLAIVREVAHFGSGYVAVGVFGGMHRDEEGVRPPVPNALVASVHEFGSPKRNIPERSYLRSTLNETKGEYASKRRKIIDKVMDGKLDAQRGLHLLGQWAQAKVQAKISSNIPPPNAPETVRRKMKKVTLKYGKEGQGSANPADKSFRGVKTLIDTGQLRTAITYEVGQGRRPRAGGKG